MWICVFNQHFEHNTKRAGQAVGPFLTGSGIYGSSCPYVMTNKMRRDMYQIEQTSIGKAMCRNSCGLVLESNFCLITGGNGNPMRYYERMS